MQESNSVQQAFPGLDPSNDVRGQVRDLAKGRYQRHRHVSRVRKMALSVVATGTLIAVGAIMGPPAYAHYRFQRIVGSVDDCQTAVITRYQVGDNGSLVIKGRISYLRGKWRLDDPDQDQLQIYSDQTLWTYSPETMTVLKSKEPDGPFGFTPTGFSLQTILADHVRWKWTPEVAIETETVDGRTVETLTMVDNERYRTRYLADPETHMPFRSTTQKRANDGWKDVEVHTFEFNSKLDPLLFEARFPSGVKVLDREVIKREWAQRLEKPIATLKSATGKIVVRDYAVNALGHIFLVFTDGQTVRRPGAPAGGHVTPTWEVTDSLGTPYYQSMRFQPYMEDSPAGKDWIVLKDGQVPQGVWLIPAKTSPFKPRKITFGARFYDSGENTSNWSLSLDQPTVRLIPEWSVACAIAPVNQAVLLREEEILRKNNGMMMIGETP